MELVAHTGNEEPAQDKSLAIKPRLTAWTSRIWRESPGRPIPLFKIEARLEIRDIENRALAEASGNMHCLAGQRSRMSSPPFDP